MNPIDIFRLSEDVARHLVADQGIGVDLAGAVRDELDSVRNGIRDDVADAVKESLSATLADFVSKAVQERLGAVPETHLALALERIKATLAEVQPGERSLNVLRRAIHDAERHATEALTPYP